MFPTIDTIVKNLKNSNKRSEKFLFSPIDLENSINKVIEQTAWIHLNSYINYLSGDSVTVCFLKSEKYRSVVTTFYKNKTKSRERWEEKRLENFEKYKNKKKKIGGVPGANNSIAVPKVDLSYNTHSKPFKGQI